MPNHPKIEPVTPPPTPTAELKSLSVPGWGSFTLRRIFRLRRRSVDPPAVAVAATTAALSTPLTERHGRIEPTLTSDGIVFVVDPSTTGTPGESVANDIVGESVTRDASSWQATIRTIASVDPATAELVERGFAWAHQELSVAERRLELAGETLGVVREKIDEMVRNLALPIGALLPSLAGRAAITAAFNRDAQRIAAQKVVVILGEWVSFAWLALAFQQIPVAAAFAPANLGGLVFATILGIAVTLGVFETAYAASHLFVARRPIAGSAFAALTVVISVIIGVARDVLIIAPSASDGTGMPDAPVTLAVSLAVGLCLASFALVVEWRDATREAALAQGRALDHQLDTAVRAEQTAEQSVGRIRTTIADYVGIASSLAASLLANRQNELATRQLAKNYQRALLALLADRVSPGVYEDGALRDALDRANAWSRGPAEARPHPIPAVPAPAELPSAPLSDRTTDQPEPPPLVNGSRQHPLPWR